MSLNFILQAQKPAEYLIAFADSSSGEVLYGFETPGGKRTIPATYELTASDTFYKIAFVLKDKEWVVINREEQVIMKPLIVDNGPDAVKEGYFRFVDNDKIGFANSYGEKIIPAQFDWVESFKGGLAAFNVDGQWEQQGEHRARTGGTWGFIERRGRKAIQAIYKQVYDFRGSHAEAWTIDGQHVLLDKKGNIKQVLKQ